MASLEVQFSQRGKGKCPNCSKPYTNRYKPKDCKQCGFFLGGSFVEKQNKRPKLDVPACTRVVHAGCLSIFSCKTSTHDDRCLVVQETRDNKTSVLCEHQDCRKNRAVWVNSNRLQEFNCKHIESVKSAVSPTKQFSSFPSLAQYSCGDSIRSELTRIQLAAGDLPLSVQVSPSMYCVFGPSTSNTPAGYCHVRVSEDTIKCCSKDCKSFIARARQHKAKNICIHVHMLFSLGVIGPSVSSEPSATLSLSLSPSATSCSPCSLEVSVPSPACPSATQTSISYASPGNVADTPYHLSSGLMAGASNASHATAAADPLTEPQDSVSRVSTIRLNVQRSLPLHIPVSVIQKAQALDVSGWPASLSPAFSKCCLCSGSLSEERCHPGQRGESLLITNLNPFRRIKVMVKFCQNQDCQAMHQVFPYDIGLFNVCDKVLVSLEILIEWRHLFRRGIPISTAIEAKLEAMAERVQDHPAENELNNISRLLYNAFFCFEAITERNLDDVICGICGVVGELYLGDGNEKNCCSISEICYTPHQGTCMSPAPTSLEDFLLMLKKRWVECTTYTRCIHKFQVHHSEIPPIMAPSIRRREVLNTEAQKKSTVLDSIKHKYQGDPAVLHGLIRDKEVDMSKIDELGLESVKNICRKCNISTALKSLERMKIDLQGLYESLLVGSCPCHGFTKVDGRTGGFYHVVCRHGVTAASKFLTLQESVRDPADLYLSFKYYPLVFICDTPCGLVRHMDCRQPEVTNQLWGNYGGCLEMPTLDKSPSKGISVPEIVLAEYRDSPRTLPHLDDKEEVSHPLTGSERRYVLGDRFHESSNPHKSPLCQFHDINLCLQSNVLKTSYQESENHRKNILRLRSSCVQGFSTHFLYNYLMDFYQNEDIVKKQRSMLQKNLREGQFIGRDKFCRFVVSAASTSSCS